MIFVIVSLGAHRELPGRLPKASSGFCCWEEGLGEGGGALGGEGGAEKRPENDSWGAFS